MTSQKLYEILAFLDSLDKKLELQTRLEGVKTALSQLVSQPATPQYQSNLAAALSALDASAAQLQDAMTPSRRAMVEGMGGAEAFDPAIAQKVRASVEKNAMTPSVAQQFVSELADRRSQFLAAVRGALDNLKKLKITGSALPTGSADLAFLIPRELFDNQLSRFAKELVFISRLLQHFTEGLTGEVEDAELEELSSSLPTIALLAKAKVIHALADIVNKFLEAWERVEKIRKIRGEMNEMGIKGPPIDVLEEQITTTIEEVVEEATAMVLVHYPGQPARKNELENAIRTDTRRLFGQIERGLTVEFRAQPKKDGDPEEQKILKDISDIARVIEFPKIPQEPMLLEGSEVLEGEIHSVKHTKKTTTRKSTVTKKEVQKDGDATKG